MLKRSVPSRRLYLKALEVFPEFAAAHSNLASILQQQGKAAGIIQARQRRNSAERNARDKAVVAAQMHEAAVANRAQATLNLSEAIARVVAKVIRRWRVRSAAALINGAAMTRAQQQRAGARAAVDRFTC